jgi:GNAT superfamily N-acetyltransferase
MVLRSIAYDDPEVSKFKEQISKYTKQVEPFGFTYRVFVEGETLVGIALIGQEPFQLFAPVGTPLIRFFVIDYQQSVDVLSAYAHEVLKLAKSQGVDFAYLNISTEHKKLVKRLQRIGFKELANRYEMSRSLENPVVSSNQLRFEKIQREDVDRFFNLMKEFMSGSPDNVLDLVMENFKNVPEPILDAWFDSAEAFFVYHNKEMIGVLDLVPQAGLIQNIGVSPAHRRKGFGKEMLQYALNLLKDAGSDRANLGVHVDNKRAFQLYKKLGFSVDKQIQTLIWWKRA